MDYYREVLEFDEQGNLIMTTRDKAATGTITYRTIGWTVKRYNTGVYDTRNQCAFLPVTTLADSRPDPENPAYKFSYFYCDKDTIFEAIGNVSAEWQQSLYANGGTVYLDAIMTVCDNGVARGALLDSAPTCTGDVYFTFDGIVNAANWRDPDSLFSHYDKNLSFPANPSYLAPDNPPYTISHYEIYGSSLYSLARYGQDVSSEFHDFLLIPVADFSSNYYILHYGSVQIFYLDGTSDTLTFDGGSPPTVSNGLHNITRVSVQLYYIRQNRSESNSLNWYFDPEKGEPLISALGNVSAGEADNVYDPSSAIPSGSFLDVTTSLNPYAFAVNWHRYYGAFTIPIQIQTSFVLKWSDSSGEHESVETISESYYVDRTYSFCILDSFQVFLLSGVNVSQDVFETDEIFLENPYIPEINIQNNEFFITHYTLPDVPSLLTTSAVLTGNGSKPEIPLQSMQALAEAYIGSILVSSDHFQIGDSVIMDSVMSDSASPDIQAPENYSLCSLSRLNVKIPDKEPNCTKSPTNFLASYEIYGQNRYFPYSYSGNPISVHTPILTNAHISNDRAKNQLEEPDSSRASLILGENFEIRIDSDGTHIDAPGYGMGNYSRYIKEIQISFPFEVYLDDTLIDADTWHTIRPDETFYLPTGVAEGCYQVLVRSTAINHSGEITDSVCEKNANLNSSHTVTTNSIPIQVMGRLYNFGFNLQNGFHPVGNRDKNGILLTDYGDISNISSVMNIAGFLPCSPGYRFMEAMDFSFTTIGDAPAYGDGIKIIPRFYHISSDGKTRREVSLYCLDDSSSISLYEPEISFSHQDCIYSGTTERNVSNTTSAVSSIQEWNGSFLMEKPFLILPADVLLTDLLEEKGSLSPADSSFIQDGFLLVNFDIYTIRKGRRYLNYLNLTNASCGYCNMWKTEGFSYAGSLPAENGQITLNFTDGDSLLFSLDEKNLRIYGTH